MKQLERDPLWQRVRRSAQLPVGGIARGRSMLLDVAGLALLAWAAGMLAVPAGIAAAGVACLLLSLRDHLRDQMRTSQ